MPADNLTWDPPSVDRTLRQGATGLVGCTVWFTGLSGSGKSTLARALEAGLIATGRPAYRLDGDNLRHGLCEDLGFSEHDRTENLRRVAHAAVLLADAGLVAITATISPLAAQRARARAVHKAAGLPFAEVFVDTPLALCEARDPKGLYAKARRGELEAFTGISAPYEAPNHPELHIHTGTEPDAALRALLDLVSSLSPDRQTRP